MGWNWYGTCVFNVFKINEPENRYTVDIVSIEGEEPAYCAAISLCYYLGNMGMEANKT